MVLTTSRQSIESGRGRSDRGTVLVLTLVLTVVLSLVIIALATYAMTGLKTSPVTTRRTESNAVTSAGLAFYIEELASKRIEPSTAVECTTTAQYSVPLGVLPPNGLSVEIHCDSTRQVGFHPTYQLVATGRTTDGTERSVVVVAQVPRKQYTVQVYSWTPD